MADRSVVVHFRADATQFLSSIKNMRQETELLAKSTGKSADSSGAWQKVGAASAAAGLVLAAGVGLAVKSFADFDKQLSVVEAVSGASAKELGRLRQAAIDAGASTKFSAAEAAEGAAELAKVGLNTSQIVGGALTGALDLAAAGGLNLASAAEIAGQTMKTFKLEGEDVPRIADALAAGANKSAAGVEDLSQALAQGGQVAAQTGLDLEDTVGVLSLFADNALKGSDAGTSLKTMLQRLNPTTVEAREEMARLGLDFFDAQGNFVGIEDVAGQLQDRLGKLSNEQRLAALSTIFGADAIRGALILYDQGASGVKDYTDSVTDQGAAARQSAVLMNNLAGDVETLGGAFETALINSGSGANDILRTLVQSGTEAVDIFNGLPRPVQTSGLAVAGLASAALLTAGALSSLAPRIVETREAIATLQATTALGRVSLASTATLLAGPWGLALAAGGIALSAFAKTAYDSKHQFDELMNSLDQTTGAITDQTRKLVAQDLIQKGAYENAQRLGVSQNLVTEAALGNADALEQLRKASIEASQATFDASGSAVLFNNAVERQGALLNTGNPVLQNFTLQTDAQSGSFLQLLNTVSPLNEALGGQSAQIKEVTDKAGITSAAVDGLSASEYEAGLSANDMAQAQDNLVQSVRSGNIAFLTQQDSIRGYEAALDAASDAIEENGKTANKQGTALKLNTEAGRANSKALEDIGTSALQSAVDILQNTGSVSKAQAQAKAGRAEFIKYAGQMGLNGGAANRLADEIGLTEDKVAELGATVRSTPSSKTIKVKVLGVSEAVNGVGRIRQQITDLNGKTVTVTTRYVETGTRPGGGRSTAGGITKASGGMITGPGTATSDSIPAYLSNGEYVVRAAAVEKYGPGFLDSVNAMRLAGGGPVGSRQPVAAGGVGDDNSTTNNFYGPDAREVVRELEMKQRKARALRPTTFAGV